MAGMDDWSPVETTLDEPVSETIRRDLREVGAKLKLVLLPRASQHGVLDRLKEWDLWGRGFECGPRWTIENEAALVPRRVML